MKEKIRKFLCVVIALMLIAFVGVLLFASAEGPSFAAQLMEAPFLSLLEPQNMVLSALIIVSIGGAFGMIWIGFIQELK